jgi:hypothetical protein
MLRSEKTRPENDWTEVARRQGREDKDGSNDLETRPNMESGASRLTHNLGAATGGMVPSEPDNYSSHHFNFWAAITKSRSGSCFASCSKPCGRTRSKASIIRFSSTTCIKAQTESF